MQVVQVGGVDDRSTTLEPDDDDMGAIGGRRPVLGFVSEETTRIEPGASLRRVAEVLRATDVSLAVVSDDAGIHGVISERDIVRAVALGLDLDATVAEAIEAEDLKWAAPTSTVDDVAEEMLENYLRHVLVGGDDGELLGVVSMRDLLTAYLV
jgi:CBS domain-containing protein